MQNIFLGFGMVAIAIISVAFLILSIKVFKDK